MEPMDSTVGPISTAAPATAGGATATITSADAPPVAMSTDEEPTSAQPQSTAQQSNENVNDSNSDSVQRAAAAAVDSQHNDNDTANEQTSDQQSANNAPAVSASPAPSTSAESTNVHSTTPAVVSSTSDVDDEDAKWHTVGIFSELNANVSSYIDNSVWSSSGLTLTSKTLPDLTKMTRVHLEPGTAYRFRLRAINSMGQSDWSEVSSFKTCLPGFPGAPSAIKISKSSEGAHLTWEPPPSCVSSNEIIEYSVYLAVKAGKDKDGKPIGIGTRSPAQLAFVRVYMGASNQCTVAHTSLSTAHIDCSNKPAIIFRIAARNDKGYGPATQVRWLQDPVQTAAAVGGGIGGGGATTAAGSSLLSPTRVKSELGSASPNKRFKGGGGGGAGSGGRNVLPLLGSDE